MGADLHMAGQTLFQARQDFLAIFRADMAQAGGDEDHPCMPGLGFKKFQGIRVAPIEFPGVLPAIDRCCPLPGSVRLSLPGGEVA